MPDTSSAPLLEMKRWRGPDDMGYLVSDGSTPSLLRERTHIKQFARPPAPSCTFTIDAGRMMRVIGSKRPHNLRQPIAIKGWEPVSTLFARRLCTRTVVRADVCGLSTLDRMVAGSSPARRFGAGSSTGRACTHSNPLPARRFLHNHLMVVRADAFGLPYTFTPPEAKICPATICGYNIRRGPKWLGYPNFSQVYPTPTTPFARSFSRSAIFP